jgi:hypothetical protein
MNDLDRVLGRSVPLRETTTTGDVAPVMSGGGMNGRPKRPGLVKKKDDDAKAARGRAVAGVLGSIGEAVEEDEYEEASEQRDGVIPKNAEELEGGRQDPSGLNIKTPEFKKRDPDSPRDEKEALLTPRAALVAPDVTPNSMTEIDPSDVPGPEGTSFKASEAAAEAPAPGPTPAAIGEPTPPEAPGIGQQDTFTTAMDTLLGRSRQAASAPTPGGRPAPPPAMESKQPISQEAAAAMFTTGSEVSGDALLRQNQPMPEPTVGDGKRVFESFRRFV